MYTLCTTVTPERTCVLTTCWTSWTLGPVVCRYITWLDEILTSLNRNIYRFSPPSVSWPSEWVTFLVSFIQSRLHLVIINLDVKIHQFQQYVRESIALNHLSSTQMHSRPYQIWRNCSQGIDGFALRLEVFVSVLRSDVLGVEVFLLEPTVSSESRGTWRQTAVNCRQDWRNN